MKVRTSSHHLTLKDVLPEAQRRFGEQAFVGEIVSPPNDQQRLMFDRSLRWLEGQARDWKRYFRSRKVARQAERLSDALSLLEYESSQEFPRLTAMLSEFRSYQETLRMNHDLEVELKKLGDYELPCRRFVAGAGLHITVEAESIEKLWNAIQLLPLVE